MKAFSSIKNSNLRRKRTTAQRCITLVSVFASIALVGLIERAGAEEECSTDVCKKTAEEVLSRMKTDVNPCDDFYQFACGKYVDDTKIPDDEKQSTLLGDLTDVVREQLKTIMLEEKPASDPKHLRFPSDLYKGCMNTDLRNSLGTEAVKELTDEVGGWPVIVGDSWSADTWSLLETLKKFRRLGIDTDPLIFFDVVGSLSDPTKYMIDMEQPPLGLDRETLVKGVDEKLVSTYYDYMVEIAEAFGADKETAKKELKDVIQFIVDLAKITMTDEMRPTFADYNNPRIIKDLQKSHTFIDWLEYVNGFLPEGTTVDENFEVNFSAAKYIDALTELLGSTDKRILANYFMWRMHEFLVPLLSDEIRAKKLKVDSAITGNNRNSNLRRKRTTAQRCITLVSVFASIALVGLIERAGAEEECSTDVCKKTAEEVLSRMKTDVNPCDDFYQFACGKYVDDTKIPDDEKQSTLLGDLTDVVREQLKTIMLEEKPASDPKHLRFPSDLYKGCMNTDLRNSLGTEAVKELTDEVGGWPVIVGDSWSADTWSLLETLKKFRRLGIDTDPLIFFDVVGSLSDPTKYMIDMEQPPLGLDRETLVKGVDEKLVSTYYDYMVEIAEAFGADKETAKKELKDVIQFIVDLAKITMTDEMRPTFADYNNPRIIKDLQKSHTFIDWLEYVNGFLPEGTTVDENFEVNFSAAKYMDALTELLGSTDKRILANYFMWRMHEFLVPLLSDEIRAKKLKVDSAITGIKKQADQWKECVDHAAGWGPTPGVKSNSLAIALGSLYVRKYFDKDAKATAEELIKSIHGSHGEMLDKVDWMSDKAKEKAKEKLTAMTAFVGYNEELIDDKKLADYYSKLEIDPDKYLKSVLNINAFAKDYRFSQLKQPVDPNNWITNGYPAVVDANYDAFKNKLIYPAGIWQGHYFNAERPKYMNYGAMGFAIGQATTSGFNKPGSQTDSTGASNPWWDSDTTEKFEKKSDCVIGEYNGFKEKLSGLDVDGKKTVDTNMADMGGMKSAYMAYNKWVDKNAEESKLPGLKYTPQQMFWVAGAQTWCAKYRKEQVENIIKTTPWPPYEFRVTGVVPELEEFVKAFDCKEGEPMVHANKCAVW